MREIHLTRIRCLIPLRMLPQKEFKRLCSDLVIEEMEPDGFLFVKGDQDASWIYLLEGELVLESDGIVMERIQGDSEAARFPLAHQIPRKVSARALTRLCYIRFDQQRLDTMENIQENTETKIASPKVSKSGDWMSRLFKSPIFQSLPASNLQRILQRFEAVEVSAGARIIDQGEEADCVYVLSSGRCQVTRKPRPHAKEFKLGEIQVGDLFGEDALISGLPRAVSVTMESDGLVQQLSKEDFLALVVDPVLTQVSLETAFREIEQGSIWLDVRDPDGFQKRHFEGSLNIPFFSLRMQLGTLDRKRRYITVCDNGNLSAAAAFLLMRYGFETSVLEGGVVSIPGKCLQGEMPPHGKEELDTTTLPHIRTQTAQETKEERVEETPSHLSRDSHHFDSSFPEPETLQALEAEKEALWQQVQELRSLLAEKDESQKTAVERLQSSLEHMRLEKEQLEEQGSALQERIKELEAVITQYVEAIQDKEEDEIIQALQTELQMVREQANMDVSAIRAALDEARHECERLQLELTQTAENTQLYFLPSELQAVDPQQLPLQASLTEEVKSQSRGGVAIQSALWFLVGLLASLSLVGIGLQTDTGKRWFTIWLQPEDHPQVSDSNFNTQRSSSSRVESSSPEELFAEEEAVVLEDAPSGNVEAPVFSDEGGEAGLFAPGE